MSKVVEIYTDGACSGNPGPGGWGAVMRWNGHEKELCGGEAETTNNRMELTAAVRALAALTRPCAVEFHTDSQYMRNGITSWIGKWRQNGWRTANKKPVENQDLWMQLYDMTQQHTIDWKWVRGHAGNQYNERVDQLATRAREQRISSEA